MIVDKEIGHTVQLTLFHFGYSIPGAIFKIAKHLLFLMWINQIE